MTNNIAWADVDSRRKILLTQSDWTQLPDAGLSSDCVMSWREWRKILRTVNSQHYKEPVGGALKIKQLIDRQPRNIYSENAVTYEIKDAVLSKVDIDVKIESALEKIDIMGTIEKNIREIVDKTPILDTTPPEIAEEGVGEVVLDNITDISSAKKHAQNALETVYRDKILKVSPPVELSQLYTERLNQAIDFLAGEGQFFPLLTVLAESLDETIDEVANSVYKRHNTMINNFNSIDIKYIKCLKEIKESDTIAGLKKALENFD